MWPRGLRKELLTGGAEHDLGIAQADADESIW
jgi:hypothetical protein